MLTTRRSHRLLFAGLAALVVAAIYGLSSPGGSQAQTPPVDATATWVAEINQLQQQLQQQTQQQGQQSQVLQQQQNTGQTQQTLLAQQTPALGGLLNQLIQNQVVQPSPTPTLPAILNVTPVANAAATNAATTAPSGVTTPVAAPPAAPIAAAAQAQDACGLSLASVSGGQTIEFQDVDVTLPSSGDFVYGFVRPDSGSTPQVVVCNMTTDSTIYINALTGREMARKASGDSGGSSLNAILSGVRTHGASAPAPSSIAISPPNTGDAGLR